MPTFQTMRQLAKYPYNVRYFEKDNFETDDSLQSEMFLESYPGYITRDDFKRGELWPSMILVEKELSGENHESRVTVFARAVKKNIDGCIFDTKLGDTLDDAYLLANHFDVPIYQITTHTNGKRTGVHRLYVKR